MCEIIVHSIPAIGTYVHVVKLSTNLSSQIVLARNLHVWAPHIFFVSYVIN